MGSRDGIALAVSEADGCDYCLAAHSFIAGSMAKVPADEIALNREGRSSDPKRQAVSTVPAASRQARLQAVRGLGRHEVVVDRIWPRGRTKQDANIDVWPKDVAPRSDLADALMVGREDFVAAPLLTLVTAPAGVPADERLLVPPVRT